MSFSVSELLILFAAVAGSGTMAGFGVWIYHWIKRKEVESRDMAEVAGQIAELRGELQDVRGQLGEVQERMDFADRVLAQIHQEAHRLPAPEPGRSDAT